MVRILASAALVALVVAAAVPSAAQSRPSPAATRNFANTPRSTNVGSAQRSHHPTKKHAAAGHRSSVTNRPQVIIDSASLDRLLASPAPKRPKQTTNTIKKFPGSDPDVFDRYDTGAPH